VLTHVQKNSMPIKTLELAKLVMKPVKCVMLVLLMNSVNVCLVLLMNHVTTVKLVPQLLTLVCIKDLFVVLTTTLS